MVLILATTVEGGGGGGGGGNRQHDETKSLSDPRCDPKVYNRDFGWGNQE